MHSFKKVVINSVIFTAIIAIISLFISGWYFRSYDNSNYYVFEELERNEGTLDMLICGASQGAMAFVPEIIDEKLGVNSFNLSTQGGPLTSRLDMCMEYIEKNPVRTVVLDLSEDALAGYNKNGKTENIQVTQRLPVRSRIPFLVKHISFEHYFDTWNEIVKYGSYDIMKQLLAMVFGGGEKIVPEKYLGKGFYSGYEGKLDFDSSSHLKNYQSLEMSMEFDEECIEKLNEFFDVCRTADINVIVVTLPVMNSYSGQFSNMNDLNSYYKVLCENKGFQYINFNLYKDKDEVFTDNSFFYDSIHLSEKGAYAFSDMFCNTMLRLEKGQSAEELFYGSFSQIFLQ